MTRMLLSIEKVLGKKTTDCFDWIAGTSTGGILALALASGKSVKECQILYMQMKDDIFSGWLPHFLKATSTTGALRTLLKKEFGENTKMKDLNKKLKVFVTAAEVDREMPDLRLLRNYEPAAKIAAKEWCELKHNVGNIPQEMYEQARQQAEKADQLRVRHLHF